MKRPFKISSTLSRSIAACALLILIPVVHLTAEPIRIGVLYGLTGPEEHRAEAGRRALELALEQHRALGGPEVVLVYEDTRSTALGAVTGLKKLVEVDHVDGIVGELFAVNTNPLIPLLAQHKTVLISPSVFDVSVEGRSEYFFTVGPRLASLQAPVEKFLTVNPQVRSVALFCHDDSWGRQFLSLWHHVVAAAGVAVKAELCENGFQTDFQAAAARVQATRPDAVLIAVRPNIAIRKVRETGFRGLYLNTIHLQEALLTGTISWEAATGAFYTAWSASTEFQKLFETRYGAPAILDSHFHFDALDSMLRAVRSSGTISPASLSQLRFQGASGEINFSGRGPEGSVNTAHGALYVVKDGAIQEVKE